MLEGLSNLAGLAAVLDLTSHERFWTSDAEGIRRRYVSIIRSSRKLVAGSEVGFRKRDITRRLKGRFDSRSAKARDGQLAPHGSAVRQRKSICWNAPIPTSLRCAANLEDSLAQKVTKPDLLHLDESTLQGEAVLNLISF